MKAVCGAPQQRSPASEAPPAMRCRSRSRHFIFPHPKPKPKGRFRIAKAEQTNTMLQESQLNGSTLAYLGDCVLELITREYLIQTGVTDVGKLNREALDFVRATRQAEAVSRILPLLDEEEAAFFKRGRNANGISAPKSASVAEYRRATGLEALFAHLYLTEKTERMRDLFRHAFVLGDQPLSVPLRSRDSAES